MFPTHEALANYLADEAEIREAYWRPQAGDVVVDIGANFGSYALPALEAGAEVVAVDSDAQALAVFAELCSQRGFTRWLTVHAAVGSPYAAELQNAIPEYMRPVDVAWRSLDSVTDFPRVDWLKIDVEGGELDVLRSGRRLLRQQRPRMLIEDHTGIYQWLEQIDSRRCVERLLTVCEYRFTLVPYHGVDGDRSYWVCEP